MGLRYKEGEVSPSLQPALRSYATPSPRGSAPKTPAFAAGGISYCYLMEALSLLGLKDIPVLKIGTPYPFPKPLAEDFLKSHEQIIVFEELDPVIEENLIKIAGSSRVNCQIRGKLDGTVPEAGELSVEIIKEILDSLSLSGSTRQSANHR